jgi:hypothetical protein
MFAEYRDFTSPVCDAFIADNDGTASRTIFEDFEAIKMDASMVVRDVYNNETRGRWGPRQTATCT